MTQEEKQLLLKDLCARLPYGVKCIIFDDTLPFGGAHGKHPFVMDGVTIEENSIDVWLEKGNFNAETVKPYLRPMSSMTEEEYKELCNSCKWLWFENDLRTVTHGDYKCYDWLDKNMFDYRGLIPMGLALEAPTNMYKIK